MDECKPLDSGSDNDDVGGTDGQEKARRRAERQNKKETEDATREYMRKRKQERARMKAESKHPGGRFRRQQAAYQNHQRQGLTLVHFSAQRKHILWDTFGAWFSPSLLDRGTGLGDQNGIG